MFRLGLLVIALLPILGGCYLLADHRSASDDVHIVDTPGALPDHSDPIRIREGRLAGNLLHLDVEHSGGCEEHGYALYGTMHWSRSIPPVASLYLHHDANGDACEAVLSPTLTYDVFRIKQAWRRRFDYRGPLRISILPIGSDEQGVMVETTL